MKVYLILMTLTFGSITILFIVDLIHWKKLEQDWITLAYTFFMFCWSAYLLVNL